MRIPIRIQLGSLILLASLIALAVVSIAVWITVHDFVLVTRASRIALTASLKAGQLSSNLALMQTSVGFISSRVLLQRALSRYNLGNNTAENWSQAQGDMQAAIGAGSSAGQTLSLQSMLFAHNATEPGGTAGLLNVTSSDALGDIALPYTYPNGSHIYLGANDSDAGAYGYPPPLYPNLTYTTVSYNNTLDLHVASYGDRTLSLDSFLFLGPWKVNETMSLVSITMPVINNTSNVDILGWVTVLMDAELISDVIDSSEGLGDTGDTLLIGPATAANVFPRSQREAADNKTASNFEVHYAFPLPLNESVRHPDHTVATANAPFNADQYPVIYQALRRADTNASDTSGSDLYAKNEMGRKVSVGYAMPASNMVDWIVIVEYDRREVWQPINQLRNVILACVFATAGFMALVAFPLAHFASLPILRLREATSRSIAPPGGSHSSQDSFVSMHDGADDDNHEAMDVARKEGFRNPIAKWRRKRARKAQWQQDDTRQRGFRIPGKVKERKSWIKDELSDLSFTFNEMSDELMMQYARLEEGVRERTAELELSKKAAEAANESKTLFVASLSHELKTPLNGILGMCAVCMQEDDPVRLKRSLGIIYKSGDLLLNLLTDLLTFSKNQVGSQLSLDEKEFRLRDISSQTLAIFDNQAKEGNIQLRVEFEGIGNFGLDSGLSERKELGPAGTGRMRDMTLWGDMHRILQIVINLTSNSLKFTPPGGSVVLTLRCLPEAPPDASSRKPSFSSKQSRQTRNSDNGLPTLVKTNTANAINAKTKPSAIVHERAASPPPGRWLYFEFEVTDTGPGIPENLQAKIFEPFVQGDLGLSKKYGGTGLGLSICSQLAQLMRGTVTVRSTVGVGSTFTLKIPLRHVFSRADSSASSAVDVAVGSPQRGRSLDEGTRTPARQSTLTNTATDETPAMDSPARKRAAGAAAASIDSPPPARLVGLSTPFFASNQPMESPGSQPAAMEQITAQAKRGGRIRVLVAEDNKVNQEVVLRMLQLEDIYDVTVAKDGQEALDMVKESMSDKEGARPFNLVLMDVQMPNLDGLESTRQIRQMGYQAPIVALTAFSEESNIKDCLDSGMNYFLSKPIRRPQLKKVLKEYCAPIPEEAEEATPPVSHQQPGGEPNTTIVMVNNPPAAEGSASPKKKGNCRLGGSSSGDALLPG